MAFIQCTQYFKGLRNEMVNDPMIALNVVDFLKLPKIDLYSSKSHRIHTSDA